MNKIDRVFKGGDVVFYDAEGARNESRVRSFSPDGLYVYIDCFVGKEMQAYRDLKVSIDKVVFIT